ncbi:MAG: ATP-binding cassette domain-containing protein [Oscillospiraceae bacterium]|nr:ATP-binding cassette domain-containing protein [Oscillospiraceae bacterium]
MPARNYITVFIGQNEPRVYDLDSYKKSTVRMGRGDHHGGEDSEINDIAIDSGVSFISRAHCTFFKTDSGWNVKDDNSVNGLTFNGVKVASKQLHDGDKFYIGQNPAERCVIAFSGIRNAENAPDSKPDSFTLEGKDKFVIGRSHECDIVVDHPSVSRFHCIITKENDGYYIADNNSMNGVILNGKPLTKKQRLEQMDKITVADTAMVFSGTILYQLGNSGGVSIAACNVVKKVKAGKGEKVITDNVSLSIEPGEFVAIVGGSGAGKTTLLNCLSGMTDFTSGDVLINGESIKTNNRSIRSIIGYVPQKDIVYDTLTLERMLIHSARLRMPKDMSKEEIDRKIDETLEMVELTKHRHTLINKLSGGQKKRASIAVELLASPKLFFLDEPSSGLDPGTEKNLMKMLKKLAMTGKTVIMVTHTVQNINLCDRLICMGSGGLLCYSGAPSKALDFFRKENITDIYDDLNEHSKEVSERFAGTNTMTGYNTGTPIAEKKQKNGIAEGIRQFRVLTQRYAEITFNSRTRLILLLAMPVVLTILVCISFQADGNLYNLLGIVINRTSMPFMVAEDTMKLMFSFGCAAFWVGIFNSVQEISKERTIYERERFTGVKPIPYVMSKFVITAGLCAVQAAIMIAMLVFFTDTVATIDGDVESATARALGMNEGGIVFENCLWLEMYITTFMSMLSAMCIGLTISAAVSNDMALVICPVCLLPQILLSGVACTLSGLTEVMSKAVTCRWACIAYFTSSKINSMYESCRYDTGIWTDTEFSNGFGVDEAYSEYKTYLFGLDPVWSSWIMLLIMSVVCVAAAVVFLYLKDIRFSAPHRKARQ